MARWKALQGYVERWGILYINIISEITWVRRYNNK